MKVIKKSALFVLTMVLIISIFAGCAAPAVEVQNNNERAEIVVEDLVIGVSMYTLGAPYFMAQLNAIEEYGNELGFDVISADAGGDMAKQLSDVEDLLARGIDLLILNPQDPIGLVPATKAATEAGVPVVIMDSTIDMTADFISIVQSNNLANGELVGEWLGETMAGQTLRIALLSGAMGNPVGKERRQGVIRGLTEYMLRTENAVTGFYIVAQGWGAWAHEGGLAAMEDILVAHPDINVLLAENDSMALGALKAIREAGKEEQILVVAAADGQREALELIKTGEYGATGLNDPVLIARTAVDIGIRYLQGETNIPKISFTPPAVITIENVDQFYDPDSVF